MAAVLEFIIGFSIVGAAIFITRFLLNRLDKQECNKAKQVWLENSSLRTLVDYYIKLKEKNIKLNERKEELRMKLKDRAYFPKESTYFKKFEFEYQQLYFKQEKVNKEMIETREAINGIAKANNIQTNYPWKEFLKKSS